MKRLSSPSIRGIFLGVLLGGGSSLPGWAQTQTTYSASSLIGALDNTGTSARATAMGSAFVAVADDSSALFWNPAGLGKLQRGDLSAYADAWLVDTARGSLSLAMPLQDFGGIGVAASYADYGAFDSRDATGALTGSYNPTKLGLKLGWGRSLFKNLAVGLAVQGAEQTLANQSYEEFGIDAGLILEIVRGVKIGMDYTNLGGARGVGILASSFRLGASYQINTSGKSNRILLAASGLVEPSGLSRLQFGAEDLLYSLFAVRVGYQDILFDNQIGGFQGMTLGGGIQWNDFSLDYAFLPFGDLGNSHQVSLDYRFDVASETKSATSPSSSTGENKSKPADSALSKPPAGSVEPQAVTVLNNDDLTVEFKLPPEASKEGKKLEGEGKVQEAIDVYTKAIEKNNEDVLAWYGLGIIYFRTHQKDYAVQCFEQVIHLQPKNQKLAAWLEKYKTAPTQ